MHKKYKFYKKYCRLRKRIVSFAFSHSYESENPEWQCAQISNCTSMLIIINATDLSLYVEDVRQETCNFVWLYALCQVSNSNHLYAFTSYSHVLYMTYRDVL